MEGEFDKELERLKNEHGVEDLDVTCEGDQGLGPCGTYHDWTDGYCRNGHPIEVDNTLTINRQDLANIFEQVLAVLNGDEEYRPVNPAICTDGNSLRLASALQPWARIYQIEGIENWFANGETHPANQVAHDVANELTTDDVKNMLGVAEHDKLIIED